jgi:hypothetical protein
VEAAAGAGGGGASGERAALVVSTPLPSVRRAGRTGKQYRRWNEDPQRSEWRDGARGHGAWSVCAFLSLLIIYLFIGSLWGFLRLLIKLETWNQDPRLICAHEHFFRSIHYTGGMMPG